MQFLISNYLLKARQNQYIGGSLRSLTALSATKQKNTVIWNYFESSYEEIHHCNSSVFQRFF